MNCHLTDQERKTGNRCRSWDCVPCKEFALSVNDAIIMNVHMSNMTLKEEINSKNQRINQLEDALRDMRDKLLFIYPECNVCAKHEKILDTINNQLNDTK